MSPGTVRPMDMDIRGLVPFDRLLVQKLHQLLTEKTRESPEYAISWCWAVKIGKRRELKNPTTAALDTGKGQETFSPRVR